MVSEKQKFIHAVQSLDLYPHEAELQSLVNYVNQPHIQLPDPVTLSHFIIWNMLRRYPTIMLDKNNKAFRQFCLSIEEAPSLRQRPHSKK